MTGNSGFEQTEFHDAEFARLKQQIKEKVRQSVRAAVADTLKARHQIHIQMHRRAHRHTDEDRRNESTESSCGPVAGSPERQAILDAIARGELSVDDAIKKLTGE
jgi:hypothetical protein